MEETIEWLARALTQLREPEPSGGSGTAALDLVNAFGPFGPPTQFVEALNARVFELSRGTMVVTSGHEAEFRGPLPRTPQIAFLVLSARKPFVLLADPNRPVRFND
jgi:hypothetical protein